MRLLLYGLSGDAPDGLADTLIAGLPADAPLLDHIPEPERLPDWLSHEDLAVYAAAFEATGFAGALLRYRNVDRDHHELPTLGTTTITQPTLFMAGDREPAVRFGDLVTCAAACRT